MKQTIAAAILSSLLLLTVCDAKQRTKANPFPLFPDPDQPKEGFQTVAERTLLTPCGILTERAMTRLRFELSEKNRTCTFVVTEGEARLDGRLLMVGKPNVASFEEENWKAYQHAYRKYLENLEAEKAMQFSWEAGGVQQTRSSEQPVSVKTPCGEIVFQGQVSWVENEDKKTCRVRVFKGSARIANEVVKPGEEVILPYKQQ
jgi:hypothetical protein